MEKDNNAPISAAMLRLQEVIDDMTQALTNLAKVNNQTKSMCKIIANSEDAEQFKEFLEGSKKEIDAKQKEYDALLRHREILTALVNKYVALYEDGKFEEAKVLDETLTSIFTAFNMLQEESFEPAEQLIEDKKLN